MSSPWAFRFFLALGLAAQALVAEAQGGAQRWVFTTTVGQSHFDNLLLLPDIPGDTLNTVGASLLYGRASPRFGLSVSGRVSANRYWEFSQSSQLNYGGGIAASLTPSPKLKLSFGLSANQGFYAPLLLGLGVQAPGTRADSANATVAADWRATTRTLLHLDGQFGYLDYRTEFSDLDPSQLPLDTLTVAGVIPPEQGAIGITGVPTPVDSSLLALGALASEGVLRSSLRLLTYRTGAVLTQTLSPKLTLSIPLGYRALDYDRTGLKGGGQFDTGTSLRRTLGPSTSVALQYTYQRNSSQVPTVTTHTALLQGEHELSPHLKIDASIGGGLTSAADSATSAGPSFLGGVGLSGRARHTKYDLHYGRSIYQAFGFGRNYVTDYASAYVEQQFSKRLGANFDARYRRSRESLLGQYAFTTQFYGINAFCRIERRTQASAYYYFRRLDGAGSSSDLDSSTWGFTFSYARSWKP